MPRSLPPTEEQNYVERLLYPNFFYATSTMSDKLRIAGEVAQRNPQQAFLLGGMAMSEPCVVAGLKPEYVEYIVRNGSLVQKSSLLDIIEFENRTSELREIARRMDLDIGGGSRTFQDNAEIIINYLHDVETAIRNDRKGEEYVITI